MLLALLDPRWQAGEAGRVGHIIYENDGVDIPVIMLHHGLPEALLTSSVPKLNLDLLPVDLHQPLPEVHPDCGLGLLWELARAEAIRKARLPDSRVPDDDNFKDTSPRRREAGASQRAREFQRGADLRHSSSRKQRQVAGGGQKDRYTSHRALATRCHCPNTKAIKVI